MMFKAAEYFHMEAAAQPHAAARELCGGAATTSRRTCF